MGNRNLIAIEIAYATPERQTVIKLEVEQGTTLEMAIERSGILELYPEIDLSKQKVGVFSKIRGLNSIVQRAERVEIYRALTVDPKEARRKRARK